jgi:hypothetical protein
VRRLGQPDTMIPGVNPRYVGVFCPLPGPRTPSKAPPSAPSARRSLAPARRLVRLVRPSFCPRCAPSRPPLSPVWRAFSLPLPHITPRRSLLPGLHLGGQGDALSSCEVSVCHSGGGRRGVTTMTTGRSCRVRAVAPPRLHAPCS